MTLYRAVCPDCMLALSATANGRVCPECGQVFASHDRSMRLLTEAQAARHVDGGARSSLVVDPPATTWEQTVMTFEGGAQ